MLNITEIKTHHTIVGPSIEEALSASKKRFVYYVPTKRVLGNGREWIIDPFIGTKIHEMADDGGLESMFGTTSSLHRPEFKLR